MPLNQIFPQSDTPKELIDMLNIPLIWIEPHRLPVDAFDLVPF